MDSLTQIALGAAVGQAVLGRQVGYRAAIWGAVCGTVPDLDVLVPMGGAVADFTYHRSFSHSLFVLTLLSPVVVWLILKLHPSTTLHKRRWFWLVILAFATHVVLDSFTIYGTQIFWPIASTPMTWGSIFIIDPLYTLPLIIGVVCTLRMRREPRRGQRWNALGLILSSVYLAWSLGAKLHVAGLAEASIARQNLASTGVLTLAAPFNTVLWRIVSMTREGYHEGFYSLLDSDAEIEFTHYRSETDLLELLQEHWPVQRLRWFTKGFYKVELVAGEILISDLRMGVEPDYVFTFKVADAGNPHVVPVADERRASARSYQRLAPIMRRIWDESVSLRASALD